MGGQKHDDPKDGAEHPLRGPALSPSGTILMVPSPLDGGAPKPEPEDERWTLGPGRHEERPSEEDDRPGAAPPTEPVRPTTPRRRG